ncbi:MAG: hypothetical protein H7A05_02345 [Pseudomonadales bacterium]|nr:hypothetical protein [Pseudomonadales bacterium]MCP5331555.1 hypothetical protein [Pseudomonadales bacterium]MCP5343438.1 hypothetical protein [Pseudomonadales bacterium]
MLDLYDYIAGWAIYLFAGTLCYMIFYRFTGRIRSKPLANTLRAVLIALMFTPWYVGPEADLLAPALMVMLLDMITVDTSAFIRAFVPLILSLVFCVLLALSGTFLKQAIKRRTKTGSS